MQGLVIIGAGKGSELIREVARGYVIVGYVDDNIKRADIFNDIFLFATTYKERYPVFISIASDMKLRKRIYEYYKDEGIGFINIIHPSAIIEPSAKLGEGNFIGANVYIGTETIIGNNNWIASGVTICHHNKVGSHNLFGPGFSIPGIVEIGDSNKFGANASLSNYTKVGNDNVILNNAWTGGNVGNGKVIGNKSRKGEVIENSQS